MSRELPAGVPASAVPFPVGVPASAGLSVSPAKAGTPTCRPAPGEMGTLLEALAPAMLPPATSGGLLQLSSAKHQQPKKQPPPLLPLPMTAEEAKKRGW